MKTDFFLKSTMAFIFINAMASSCSFSLQLPLAFVTHYLILLLEKTSLFSFHRPYPPGGPAASLHIHFQCPFLIFFHLFELLMV